VRGERPTSLGDLGAVTGGSFFKKETGVRRASIKGDLI